MRNFIFFIYLGFFNHAFGQNIETKQLEPCGDNIKQMLIVNGLVFNQRTKLDSINNIQTKFCDSIPHIYFLEGLELSERQFLDIGIKAKDCIQENLVYEFANNQNDSVKCIDTIYLFVSLAIPIHLNGKELTQIKKTNYLQDIKIQSSSIRIRRKFIKKAILEIITY